MKPINENMTKKCVNLKSTKRSNWSMKKRSKVTLDQTHKKQMTLPLENNPQDQRKVSSKILSTDL